MSLPYKRTLLSVIFETFQSVSSVSFLPASVCAAIAAGTGNALVVDIQQEEITVVPVSAYTELGFHARVSSRPFPYVRSTDKMLIGKDVLEQLYFLPFNGHDTEDDEGELSLDAVICDVLMRLNTDLRSKVAQHIIFIGPMSEVPGLKLLTLQRVRAMIRTTKGRETQFAAGCTSSPTMPIHAIQTLGPHAGAAIYLSRTSVKGIDRSSWESDSYTLHDWLLPYVK